MNVVACEESSRWEVVAETDEEAELPSWPWRSSQTKKGDEARALCGCDGAGGGANGGAGAPSAASSVSSVLCSALAAVQEGPPQGGRRRIPLWAVVLGVPAVVIALSLGALCLAGQSKARRGLRTNAGGPLVVQMQEEKEVNHHFLKSDVQAPPRAAQVLATTPPPVAPLNRSIAAVDQSANMTLYCFAMVIKDSVEPWLIRAQLIRDTGIFGCHHHTLFSDKPLWLDAGRGRPLLEAVAVPGKKAWQGPVPGTGELVWHNTGVFLRAWKWIQEHGMYKRAEWTVKVDPDTVFLPGSLQQNLLAHHAPGGGGSGSSYMEALDPEMPEYIVNCKQWYSFQGPLEIYSRAAAAQFFEGLETCKSGLQWRTWGEDWFMGHCLDLLGVQKREGFGLLDDMYCRTPLDNQGNTYFSEYKLHGPTCIDDKSAFHPYKTVPELTRCLDQAASLDEGASDATDTEHSPHRGHEPEEDRDGDIVFKQ